MKVEAQSAPIIAVPLTTYDNRELTRVKEKAQPFQYLHEDSDIVAVLVHGFTGSPHDMRELAEFLHSHGVDVIGVRLAGHGSHYEDLLKTGVGDWWNSVKEAAERVERTHKRVFLVGYSFGANIILDLAARHPEKYAGIVCLSTSIYFRRHNLFWWYYQMMRWTGHKKWRKRYVPKNNIETFESTGNYAHIPVKNATQVYQFIKNYTKKELHRVMTPALIIHSRDDRISDPKSSEYLFEKMGSQYKEMFIMNDLNHNPLRSGNKERIFDRVVQFILS